MDFSNNAESLSQPARVVGNRIVKSPTGNPAMVMAWGVDGRQGDFYLTYNTIVAAQDETVLLFAFGGQETTLFRNRWVGGDSLLLGHGYLYGEGNWLRRGASLYSFSGTIFNAASISCPAWMPSIALPSFEPGRGKVVRIDGGRRPGANGDLAGCVLEG